MFCHTTNTNFFQWQDFTKKEMKQRSGAATKIQMGPQISIRQPFLITFWPRDRSALGEKGKSAEREKKSMRKKERIPIMTMGLLSYYAFEIKMGYIVLGHNRNR